MKRVVLLSGGLDSALAAGIASIDHNASLFFYTRRHGNIQEDKAFNLLTNHFKPAGYKIDNTPYNHPGEFKNYDRAISTGAVNYDGRKNRILLMAATYLDSVLARGEPGEVVFGINNDDLVTTPLEKDHFRDIEREIQRYLNNTNIHLSTPLQNYSKRKVVELADVLKVPAELTWSCHTDKNVPCGICDACKLREFSFRTSGLIDPLKYSFSLS